MKEFAHHGPCPECGSRDNLGTWTDGQQYCFGCGYHVRGENETSIESMKARTSQLQQEEKSPSDSSSTLCLPSDYSRSLPIDPTRWLTRYGISKGERIKHRIGWSDKYESLVFPVFDVHNNLLLVQRRYFGNGKWPKYHTKGKPETLIHVVGDTDDDVGILVEDLISAIKVGRHFDAVPLWGSHLSNEKIKQLSHRFAKLILWLDRDKAKEAVKYKWRASPFFEKVSIIVSEKDPKEYNDDAILDFVTPNTQAI